MTSLLNLFGSSSNSLNMFLNLIGDDDFVTLTNNINDTGIGEYTDRMIVKFMYKILDPIVIPFLQKHENNNIFNNTKLTKENQIKVFLAKLIAYLYQYQTQNNVLAQNIQFMGDMKVLIKDTSETLYNFIDIDKVRDGSDIYRILLEHFSLTVSKKITLFTSFVTKDLPHASKDMYTIVNDASKIANDIYSYTPHLYKNRNDDKKNNDSDSDSDNDTDGDTGNDDTKKTPKDETSDNKKNRSSPIKRARDDLDDEDDETPKDLKKRKNE